MRHAGDAFESYTFVRKWGKLYEQILKWTARNVPKKLVKMPKKLSKILREKKISKIPKKISKIQKKLWKYRETNLQDTENSTTYRNTSPKSSTKYRKIVETKKNFICKTIGESMQHVWRDSPGRKRRPESLGLLVPFISGLSVEVKVGRLEVRGGSREVSRLKFRCARLPEMLAGWTNTY